MATNKAKTISLMRVEGLANILLNEEDGDLQGVSLQVMEASRSFPGLLIGRPINEVPLICSRVSARSSSCYSLVSILALEDALQVEVSERTRDLRELLTLSAVLQSHSAHLLYSELPDSLGLANALALAREYPAEYEGLQTLRQVSGGLAALVGGRAIHPITPVVGGFSADVDSASLAKMAEALLGALPFAEHLADIIGTCVIPAFHTEGDFMAMKDLDSYTFGGGDLRTLLVPHAWDVSSAGEHFEPGSLEGSSQVTPVLVDGGRPCMVGALSRLNHSWANLTQRARIAAAKVALRPVCLNPFRNGLSQAIEMVDALERASVLCDKLSRDGSSCAPAGYDVKAGSGLACVESPLGTLYMDISLDSAGIVTNARIVTPSQVNLSNLVADINSFVPTLRQEGSAAVSEGVARLVRAYDLSFCDAVH